MDKECRILIADDVEFSRTVLKKLLGRDYDIVEAENGVQVVQILRECADQFSCILLDVRMPGLDGYGVLDYMKASGLLERIPVIAITSLSDVKSHVQCYEAGVIDLIEKPFYEDMVLYKVGFNIKRFRRFRQLAHAAETHVSAKVKAYFKETFGFEAEEDVESMFASFLESLEGCVVKLEGLGQSPDFMAVREATHAIRGFVVPSVMPELTDVNLLLNTCAKAGDAAAVCAGVRRLRSILEWYRTGKA